MKSGRRKFSTPVRQGGGYIVVRAESGRLTRGSNFFDVPRLSRARSIASCTPEKCQRMAAGAAQFVPATVGFRPGAPGKFSAEGRNSFQAWQIPTKFGEVRYVSIAVSLSTAPTSIFEIFSITMRGAKTQSTSSRGSFYWQISISGDSSSS